MCILVCIASADIYEPNQEGINELNDIALSPILAQSPLLVNRHFGGYFAVPSPPPTPPVTPPVPTRADNVPDVVTYLTT